MSKKSIGRTQEQQRNSEDDRATREVNRANGGTNGGVPGGNHAETASNRGDSGFTNDEIAARAYELYEREGRSDGRAMDHWLQAEAELRTERQAAGSSQENRKDLPRSARQMGSPAGM